MNARNDHDAIAVMLRQMPKPSMPADLIASIEAATILRRRWWESDMFRVRWMPAVLGLATALGALWLSRIQQHPGPRAAVSMAAQPHPVRATLHAHLPYDAPLNSEKGERHENAKS